MKTNLLHLLALILILTTSCKNNEKVEEKQVTETAEVPKESQRFIVELDVMASKKDDFAVYYTEDNTINFVPEMTVWRGVTGENKRENIVFYFSEELLPTDIRLDFGMNKEQDSVTLYNLKISYYGKDFTIKGSDFFKFFLENSDFNSKIDVQNGTLTLLKKGDEYATPFFYPRQELKDEIKKLSSVN